jgi:hypothetical protein
MTTEEYESLKELFDFIKKFKAIYDRETSKLPYHINLIDELHANENAHSRILEKLLNQKTNDGKYEILTSFVEYLKKKRNKRKKIIRPHYRRKSAHNAGRTTHRFMD